MGADPKTADVPAVAPFDHHAPDWAADWPGVTSRLRDQCPVARTDAHGGYWLVTGYDEAMAIAMGAEFMSGRVNGESSYFVPSMPLPLIPLESDPPVHTKLRRTLNPIFTERMADLWEPFIRQATDALVDPHIASGRIDLLTDLSRRVTATVNLALVGLVELAATAEQVDRFVTAPGIVAREKAGSPAYLEAIAATEEMDDVVRQLIRDRRRAPRDDVATVVAHIELEGDDETVEATRVRLIQNLVAGGNATTTSLIAHGLMWLSEHPAERAELIAEPGRLESAVEEFIRFYSPAHCVGRRAREDAEVAGATIPAGERVILCFAAANRDERAIERANEVLLDRGAQQRHLAFGYGRHRCIGRYFARTTARVVIGRLLERMPDYRVHVDEVVHYTDVASVNGIHSMPASFTPGRPTGAAMPSDCPPLPDKVKV